MFHPWKTLSMEPEKGANKWRLERKMMMPTLPTCEVHFANLSGFH
jgi:hypothetical protein